MERRATAAPTFFHAILRKLMHVQKRRKEKHENNNNMKSLSFKEEEKKLNAHTRTHFQLLR